MHCRSAAHIVEASKWVAVDDYSMEYTEIENRSSLNHHDAALLPCPS